MKITKYTWTHSGRCNWVVTHGSGKNAVDKVFDAEAEARAYLASFRTARRAAMERRHNHASFTTFTTYK